MPEKTREVPQFAIKTYSDTLVIESTHEYNSLVTRQVEPQTGVCMNFFGYTSLLGVWLPVHGPYGSNFPCTFNDQLEYEHRLRW